jgi:hypothetical protein
MGREQLIQQLNSGFAALLESVEGLSDEQMTRVWYDDWGVRDVLAHVAGWHREMAKAFERIAQGERPVPEGVDYSNFDAWNANFASDASSVNPSTVIAELQASQKAFVDAASSLPEDRFEEGKTAYRILHTTGIEHYREHEPPIREWRKSEGI